MKFGVGKLESLGLPDGEEIMPLAFFVSTQYGRTDRLTDTLWSLLPALA